jgi:hypothetical protein
MPKGKKKPVAKKQQKKQQKKQPQPQTQALAKIEKPDSVELVSAVPSIKGTIKNLENVRRFVTRCLNADLQDALARLPAGQKLSDEERTRLEVDWGTIPGVDKPFLKQPGAEKVLFWLNLRPTYTKREVELPGGHLEIIASCKFYSKKTKEEVFEGPDCSCSTMESNYRFRWADVDKDKKPPEAEQDRLKRIGFGRFRRKAIWVHGKKTGEEWVWQERVENPNIHDERNKVRQIGEKRALVKGVRNMGAMSEIFTSDPSEWNIPDDDDDPRNDQDYTESGRRIVTAEGKTPSGKPVGYQPEGSLEAAQEVGRQKIEAHKKREEEKKAVVEPAATTPPLPKQIVEVVFPSQRSEVAYVYGDLATLIPYLENHGGIFNEQKCWEVPAQFVPDLEMVVKSKGFQYKQRVSGATPTAPEPAGQSRPQQQGRQEPPSLAVPAVGMVNSVRKNKAEKGKNPSMTVNCAGFWLYCYDAKLFGHLEKSANKQCEFITQKASSGPIKIVGIKRIGDQEFDEGHLPVIQRNLL